MAHDTGKNVPNLVLLTFLICAVMGSFTSSIGRVFLHERSGSDTLSSHSYFTPISQDVDWLAEDTPTIGKPHKHSNPPLRKGLLRVFILAGVSCIHTNPANANLKSDKNDGLLTAKNLIPLKLRT